MSTAFHMARLLEANGLGTFAGTNAWAIAVAMEPEKPVKMITLYDTGGAGPDTAEMDIDRCEFQVRVRALNYVEAFVKMRAVRAFLLSAVAITTVDSVAYKGIYVTSDILSTGKDDNDRFILTCNFRTLSHGA